MSPTPRRQPRTVGLYSLVLAALLAAAAAAAPVHYRINAELNAAGDLLGTETVTITNGGPEPLSRARLVAEGLRVTGVDCPAGSRQVALAPDSTVLVLAPPVAAGESLTLELRFAAPARAAPGRLTVFADWHPRVDLDGRPAVADFAVRLTVPGELVVAATGSRVNQPAELDWMRWPPDFRRLQPVNRKVLEFAAAGVPGFAWTVGGDLVLLAADSTLEVFCRAADRLAWRDIPATVRAILDRYREWYGPVPLGPVAVIGAGRSLPADRSLPGLALVAARPLPPTRLFERSLARLLARQWFAAETDGRLAAGLAAYSATRALESAYGTDNLLDLPVDFALLRGTGDNYLSRLMLHLVASNGLLGPEPDTNRWLNEAYDARTALFLSGRARRLGADAFDLALRQFVASAQAATDFADALEAAGDGLAQQWLVRPEPWDNAVVGASRRGDATTVRLSQRGIPAPAWLSVTYADGAVERLLWDPADGPQVTLPGGRGVRSVVVDPDGELVEANRWNNAWPRRVEVKPIIALPSLDKYQFFYGPYVWWDDYHGFQLGAWAQGREFVIAGPLRGRHMWTLSELYNTNLRSWHSSLSYQTPLSLVSDRLRFSCLLDYSDIAAGARVNFVQELGNAFGLPNATADIGYRFYDLFNIRRRDPRAWDTSRIAEARLRLEHAAGSRAVRSQHVLNVAIGRTELGGNYNYLKASLEENLRLDIGPRSSVTLRGFGGYIGGPIPNQEQFYLSGGLIADSDEPVSWGLRGMSAGQENWHYDSDVNCRGFSGEWRHGRFGYGANLFVYPLRQAALFFDAGNVSDAPGAPATWPPRLDAGVRLRLGPLYADFPFWRWSGDRGHEFAFRWMLGLKISGLLGG